MTLEEYQWNVNLVKERNLYLNLTYEQAEKIYKYEQYKVNYSDKHFFSPWEEWDYELTTFSEILNDEQLTNYKAILEKNIKHYEKSLIEHDDENTTEIAYLEELINFYESQFLSEFFKDPVLRYSRLYTERAKIDYLRTEYKRYLNDTKMEVLTSHFRQYRTFKPQKLKASLLRHHLLYIFPDYTFFKHKMDEPTKAVADYIKTKLRYLPDETEELLSRKFGELKEFNEANFKKHYGDIRGWYVVTEQLTQEEERNVRTMTLLLLDKDKYNC